MRSWERNTARNIFLIGIKKKLETDWWYALDFFFSHSFMRGRKDELSWDYYLFTLEVLKKHFSINGKNQDGGYISIINKKEDFNKRIISNFKEKRQIDGRKNSLRKEYREEFIKYVSEKNPLVKELITPINIKIKEDGKENTKKVHLGNDKDVMMVLDILKFISSDKNKKNLYRYIKNQLEESKVDKTYKQLNEFAYRGIHL